MLEGRQSETCIVPARLALNIQAAYTPDHRRERAAGQRQGTLEATYRACEARYARRCLAEFACCYNRRYQLVDLVLRLACVAMRTTPPPDRLSWAGIAGQPEKA